MDVDQVTEELYGLAPGEFVPARDAYVARARKAKERAAAKAIAALRRPTLALWAANLLARDMPNEAEQLLALGRTLREAHRTLDAQQLREASRQQHKVISALAREAAALATRAGQPVSESVRHEVEQILHAVLATPELGERWAAGRLTKAPAPVVGFGAVPPDAPSDAGNGDGPRKSRAAAQAPPKTKRERNRAATAEHRARLDRARAAVEEAEAEARSQEQTLRTSQEGQAAVHGRVDELTAHVTELEARLRTARQDLRDAREAARATDAEAKEAERAARKARRTADGAARTLSRLGAHDGGGRIGTEGG